MGVYIKDMTLDEAKWLLGPTRENEIIEVKAPHGRLIDVNDYFNREYGDARIFIDNAPTIIEAEPNEDYWTCKNYNTKKCNRCGVEADYYETEVE